MNLDLLRSLTAIVAHGSLNRAAEQLRVSQSTLTRQMQALENEVGGRLLERTSSGVALTATGHVLFDGVKPLLSAFEKVLEDVRRLGRGQSEEIRIGYLMSAATEFLHPALLALRRAHPHVKAKLHNLSPGEQIARLRQGAIDVAIVGQAGATLSREFYTRKIAAVPVFVAMAETHPLAVKATVALSELRKERFVGAADVDMPGHNAWIAHVCRRAKFRPRFVQDAESITDSLAVILTEEAVGLFPEYQRKSRVPGIVFRPLSDSRIAWDLYAAWQRGRVLPAVRTLVDALVRKDARGEAAKM